MNWVKTINWSPLTYSETAIAAREAAEGLFSRLAWLTLKPQVVVDMGCGPGSALLRLQNHYPDACLLAFDLSEPMLQQAQQRPTSAHCICANAEALPLAVQSVDLIFANFLLPWHVNMKALLREWRRVLRPDGALLFTALGPDTLKECRGLWREQGVPDLVDMHVLGDWLLEEKFSGPVLDVDFFTLTYRDVNQLLHELHASGMLKTTGTDTESKIAQTACLPSVDGRFQITYEVVFAHAFVADEKSGAAASAEGVVRVPIAHLRNR
jgi:malonyl-CoA O-methyltransferase